MTEEIRQEAMQRAKDDAIKLIGADLIGTAEQRIKLSREDKRSLLRYLNIRGNYWANQLTPEIVSVSSDGVQLEPVVVINFYG